MRAEYDQRKMAAADHLQVMITHLRERLAKIDEADAAAEFFGAVPEVDPMRTASALWVALLALAKAGPVEDVAR